MKSSERRLKLMLLLQQPGRKLTVEEIAEKFGVSRRTIFRDFNALQEINVPVTWDKYAGYGVMPGYKVPPLMFTPKELATIMVGLNFVKSQIDEQLVNDAHGVELKIKNVLPDDLKELMSSLEERTIVDPYMKFGAEKKKGGDWYLLSSAIAQKKRVEFQYTTKSGKTEIRKVDPLLLVFFEDHWNMIGRSHLRGEIRNFILQNMREIRILEEIVAIKNKNCHFKKVDVTNFKKMKTFINDFYKKQKSIDYLINTTGVLWFNKDVSAVNINSDIWDKVFKINLKSMMYLSKIIVPLMKKNKFGSMVHISSIDALSGDDKPQDAYGASKAAMIRLSKSFAIQFASSNIRSNIILPGPIETGMQIRWKKNPKAKKNLEKFIPLNRVGKPEDIANASVFLLSEQANFITGTEIIVDGGLTSKP